jgi:hypothetical protein
MPMSIREWRRLDVHNGLLLSALWDAAFDQGLVSFADNGSVLASSQLSETARKALDLDHVPLLAVLRDASRASTPTMTTLPLAAQPITEVGDPFQGRLTRRPWLIMQALSPGHPLPKLTGGNGIVPEGGRLTIYQKSGCRKESTPMRRFRISTTTSRRRPVTAWKEGSEGSCSLDSSWYPLPRIIAKRAVAAGDILASSSK